MRKDVFVSTKPRVTDMTNYELRKQAEAEGKPEWMYKPVNDKLPSEETWKTLPSYFTEMVKEKNDKVNRIMSEMVSPMSFVFFSDAHIRQNTMSSVPIIRSILENTNVKDVIYGGDTVSGWVDNDMMYEDVRYFNRAYEFAEPYIVRGNHDMEGKPFELSEEGYIAPHGDVLRELFPKFHDDVEIIPGATYYSFSRHEHNIYFLVIDTTEVHERVVNPDGSWGSNVYPSEKQLRWFAESLFATPPHHSVIVLGHTPVYKELVWHFIGSQPFRDIIEAYNSRSTVMIGSTKFDFASAQGKVIMTLSGHGHTDDIFISPTGNYVYEINDDSNIDNGGSIYKRVAGTTSESALDVIIIDRATSKAVSIRYGAGIDREFVVGG